MSQRIRQVSAKPPRPRVSLQDRFELFFSRGRRIDGLWIGGVGEKSSPASHRVEGALGLIKTYDRIKYDRLLRDLDRIFIRVLPESYGSFNASLKACQLDERFVLDEKSAPELIASGIVHEATHARLMRCGIGYEAELRARVEKVCTRRQLAFAAKLPNGEEIRAQTDPELAHLPQDYWTNEAFVDRYLKGSAEALRYLGMPNWLIRATFGVYTLNLGLRRLAGHLTRLFRA
jgi:hypothetical protein